MIRFNLKCTCEATFEGWFRSNADFEAQIDSGFLTCPSCGGANVTKALMAPNVTGTKRNRETVAQEAAMAASQEQARVHSAQDSSETSKTTDAPAASLPSAHIPPAMDPAQIKQVVEALRELKRRVTAEATYVGNKFADEARKMHFGEAELRAIYGEATVDDAKELLEEGIEIAPLPILPEDHN